MVKGVLGKMKEGRKKWGMRGRKKEKDLAVAQESGWGLLGEVWGLEMVCNTNKRDENNGVIKREEEEEKENKCKM